MPCSISLRTIVMGVLAAAVVGLSTVVALDHTVGSPAPVTATVVSAPVKGHDAGAQPLATLLAKSGGPMKILQWLSKETGVPAQQIIAEIRDGKTLNQIAGAKAASLKSDILEYVSTALDKAVAKGAITSSQRSQLMSDAGSAIDVLMNAKLGALFAGH